MIEPVVLEVVVGRGEVIASTGSEGVNPSSLPARDGAFDREDSDILHWTDLKVRYCRDNPGGHVGAPDTLLS